MFLYLNSSKFIFYFMSDFIITARGKRKWKMSSIGINGKGVFFVITTFCNNRKLFFHLGKTILLKSALLNDNLQLHQLTWTCSSPNFLINHLFGLHGTISQVKFKSISIWLISDSHCLQQKLLAYFSEPSEVGKPITFYKVILDNMNKKTERYVYIDGPIGRDI